LAPRELGGQADEIQSRFGFAGILTVENIVRDLHLWQP
jgi:hypothetical protein